MEAILLPQMTIRVQNKVEPKNRKPFHKWLENIDNYHQKKFR